MPNHLHILILLNEKSVTIDKVIGEGKRFMAYQIITKLKKQNRNDLLKILADGVTEFERKRGVEHKVFENSFDGKECYTGEFIQQKLRYIHANHVTERWKLSNLREDYLHSSAKFYLTGVHGIYRVTNYLEYYDVPIDN